MSDRDQLIAKAFDNVNMRLRRLETQREINEGDLKDIQLEFGKVRREFIHLYKEIDALKDIIEELRK